MDKLELRHLAPYLPYGLKCEQYGEAFGLRDWLGWGVEFKDKAGSVHVPLRAVKPILRPLSAYKNLFGKALIDLNCDLETQIQITEFANQDRSLNSISYDAYNQLVKAKVDVFGLIDRGLAVESTKLEVGNI